MEAENYGKKYLKKYQWGEEYGSYEDGCALLAAKQLYDATGEEACFSFVKNYMDAFLSADGGIGNCAADVFSADCAYNGRTLFLLYNKTGEEKYRKAIETVMNGLCAYPRNESGSFVYDRERPEEQTIEALYRIQPFYMEYETVCGKKEKYNDIMEQFENARKLICKGEKSQGRSAVQYLAALVDTMESMSIQIYEQYRKLQDIFKETLKAVLINNDRDDFEEAMIGYCILKACRMGILLKEKYVGTGMEIVEKLAAKVEASEEAVYGTEAVCAFLMAYGQYLQTKKEMES